MNEERFEDEMLDKKSFRRNKLLKIGGTDKNRTYTFTIAGGAKSGRIEPDIFDEIVIDILSDQKHFDEILTEFSEYFEDGNTVKEKYILKKLLRIKLRKGLYSRLYEVAEQN